MSILRRIVVVSNESHIHDAARQVAQEVFMADDLCEAVDIVNTVTPEMAIFDDTVPPERIRAFLNQTDNDPRHSTVSVVALSQEARFSAHEYEDAGVCCCLLREQEHQRLMEIAVQLKEKSQRASDPAGLGDYLDETAAAIGMVGRSKAIRNTLDLVKLLAHSRCNPILIAGETGTGKEVAAKGIHVIRHPDKPFVAINCAALTANLLESELFGHVKGSFTGADRDKTGLLELAGEGTLFLDEISEMPLDLQAKLLRVLQEKTFRKVGGTKDLACQATIIASSNRNLKKEVEERRFRQDLYYRLNICPIVLAPLRTPERRGDIQLLAEYFLRTSSICGHRQTKAAAITPLALEALSRHSWPGNVRELRNVIERALLLERKDKIGLDSIGIEVSETQETVGGPCSGRVKDFSLEKAERELIARALRETGWQKTQAASLLGITRATLYAKVKQYNIQKETSPRDGIALDSSQPAEQEPAIVGIGPGCQKTCRSV